MAERKYGVSQQDLFARLPLELINDSRLKGSDLLTYMALASFAGFIDKKAWPSLTSIAERARLSRRSIAPAIRLLESTGWVAAIRRKGRPTVYRLMATRANGTLHQGNPDTGTRANGTLEREPMNESQEREIPPKVDTRGFTDLWREFAGDGAILNGRDYAHVKELLKEHSLADLRELASHYFKQDWWFTKDGKDFDSFYLHIGKVAANLRPGTLKVGAPTTNGSYPRYRLRHPACGWESPANGPFNWSITWCPKCETPEDGRPNLVRFPA